ncbi:Fructose-1,6-bisphosphatase class 2 [Anaerobiospirillum thomasii]|uniref:Fructose-1,6-bisphosphatase n=1 Tax=Anaerobiospirillum thomasii TaxID=179995 RepID=A0A2X0VBN5_9GAMM|nr:class II fructose-bisphosphatase [Anaerobiospirillum thomasii]SPT68915.1 Fructose-1,6-bisphosphatase class 2 [Anaerobiospirillum thomasii]SPT71143.1 Fructose-1,6-bisphosphatase class 2 [Anaerobiospirillum thomasii]
MSSHLTDKNIALDLVRVTEAGALAAARFFGRGDKNGADGAAVNAMAQAFASLNIKGTVVIGEGEKDKAPMFYHGQEVGTGSGVAFDIAIDPVEGTNAVAFGRQNALAVVGISPRGTMFNPGKSFYCKKICAGAEAAQVLDIDAPIEDTLQKVALALGKDIRDVNVFVLDKPRHNELIERIRLAGARVHLHSDGDVAGSLMAVDPRSPIDLMVGTGGTPEGIISACAIKGSGGQMLTKLDPQSEGEYKAIIDQGIDVNMVRSIDDLITSDECYFAATGISEGEILRGVQYEGLYAVTSSLTTRGRTGTIRYIEAWHNRAKLARMSGLDI